MNKDDETILEDTLETPADETECRATAQQDDPQKQYDELLDRLQRSMAEFDNFRKRTAKEKASMYDDGVRDTIETLLPVIDNFQRAIAAAPDKTDGFYKGIDMIYRQLMAVLDELGVEVLPSVGETFDLSIHHAVMHIEDPAYGENEVIDELQKGYRYKDRVIRHSMVKVAN